MPPAAFTPKSGSTAARMSRTSATVAPPPGLEPVEVFTSTAPASCTNRQAMAFSSSGRRHVSSMTLTGDPRHGADDLRDCLPALMILPPNRRYFWNGARIFSISAWAFFIPASGVYFSSRISWKVVTKTLRIFQLSWVLISGRP